MKLLRRPANDLSELFWNLAYVLASHLCKHDTIAIAVDELHWSIELEQTRQRFARHRAWKHIAPDHDMLYSCFTNIVEDSLECAEVSMNVIECSDPHKNLPLYRRKWLAAERSALSRAPQ
jgi:hypothetical protein